MEPGEDLIPFRLRRYLRIASADECWEWFGTRIPSGYGVCVWHGRRTMAHRVIFEIVRGEPLGGLFACHHCDNPPCCNPTHLFAGTHADNMRDMRLKGRGGRGGRKRKTVEGSANEESAGRTTILTEQDVIAIRRRSADGESSTAMGREFGVNRGTIWRIARRDLWGHVP